MQTNVSQLISGGRLSYIANFTPDDSDEYRARLFVYYNGYNVFSGANGYGLTVDSPTVTYDDWATQFRPPRIDEHKFNMELAVALTAGENTIKFSNSFSNESESYIESAINPMNFLVERKIAEVAIVNIHVTKNEVFLELADTVDDGIAVTLDNRSLSARHLLGENGLRICGTYQLTHVSGNVYKYHVEHYTKLDTPIDIDPTGYTCTIWEACYYEAQGINLHRESKESASFNFTTLHWGYRVPFAVGDEICISNCICRVIKIDGFSVHVAAELSDSVVTVNIKCCPRVPSLAVAINWPSVSYPINRSETDEILVGNAPNYSHTENTEYVYPTTDTYFVDGEDGANHDNEPLLKCSTGSTESVVCMQFAANSINATATASADLSLHVTGMNYSESTIIVYQMNTSAWSPAMTYQQVMQCVSGIPIGTKTLKNPTLGDYNTAEIGTRDPETDDYDCTVTIPISSSVLTEWLSGDGTYTPSIAIRIIGEGDQSVSFVSTSGNSVDVMPRICLTGGSSGAHPEPFEIELSSDTVEPGQVLRITPVDSTVNTFGNSIFNLEVEIDDNPVHIENGDATYLDVVVPDNVSGSVAVYVKQKDGDRLTDDATVYVDTSKVNRNVALAKKLKPGVIDPHKVNSTALYNRDMGFVDMTEVTDETSLIQNVYMILLTNPGERLFSQDFGTGIEQKLFKLGSVEEGISLLQECIRKVNIYEPRVYIDGDQSMCEFDNSLNHYTLILCCVLPTGRSEYIKLPFKNRGTVI